MLPSMLYVRVPLTRQQLWGVEESAAEQADVIVNHNICVLEVSEEDHLDDWLAALKGQNAGSCRPGDGAGAIHATFGKGHPTKHDLCCPQPRLLLRALLAQPLDMLRSKVRPSHMHVVDTVVSSLWTDLVMWMMSSVGGQARKLCCWRGCSRRPCGIALWKE